MKYLNTKYSLFLENIEEVETETEKNPIRKYEIVQFTEEFTIENVFGGDQNIDIKISMGDKVKLYFDIKETNDSQYVITAIRPIETGISEKEDIKEKSVLDLRDLWEGNFMLETPITINKSKTPFKIENYI